MIFNQIKEIDYSSIKYPFKIEVERKAWDKIIGWTKAATSEVSGLGLAKTDGKTYKIFDSFLVKQNCGWAHTNFVKNEFHKKFIELVDKNLNQYVLNWWHSHYNFNPFMSGIDVETAVKLSKNAHKGFVSIVVNQREEFKTALTFGGRNLLINDVPLHLVGNSLDNKPNFKDDIKNYVIKEKTIFSEIDDGWAWNKGKKIFEINNGYREI